MKKSCVYNYGNFSRLKDIEENAVVMPIDVEPVMQSHSPKDSFLAIVYSVDERTKAPTGDIKYLVSDKANPEVKQWVLNNLMMDTSSAKAPAPPVGVSDDDIIALARQPNETRDAYLARVNGFMQENKEVYERLSTEYLEKQRSLSSKPE